ncbi:albumin-like [Molossus molossus]|uniref:Albumin n=1 Tax=Molossus molossus TaxID=27622 RepID=A0A7J8JQ54_MOLMO|nr:albumin-like [Molossus molossus]KAF6498908.1 albumin [Molossus molossus]
MQWVTFTCVLLLFSSAYSRGVFRRDAPLSEIAHRYKDLGEDFFKALELVDFSQFLRKSTLDEIVKLTSQLTDLGKACSLDELGENCGKPLRTLFGEKLCSVPSLRETYGDMADCCNKAEPDRYTCFLTHKDDDLDLPPQGSMSPDATCTAFEQYEQKLLGTYMYEIARRNPYFYAPELLYYTQQYKGVLTECCKANDKAACLGPKMDDLQRKVQISSYKEKFKCSTLKKSGESALQKWFAVLLTQKFGGASFETVSTLATDYTKVHKECCHGDLLECADDRADLANYMCQNQASISTKLSDCCTKPVLEKSHCLDTVAGDNSGANIVSLTANFVEHKDVCKNYMEAKDDFLGKFLHEYSRSHPDYSIALLLRLAKAYEATLERCCATDDAHACYSKAFDEFKPLVDEPHELVKKNCELFEQLGECGFQTALLVRYTKKVPQLSTPTLVEFTRKVGRMGSKCCKLPEAKRMGCADDYLSAILNSFCLAHEKTPVSERVTKCCTESFANRRPCFSALEVDSTYVPKEFNAETFTFHADVCTLPESEQLVKKQTALVELLKHKPKATEEQLNTVIRDFLTFLQKCCSAADKEGCFAEEGPKLVASSQAVFA